VGLTNYILTCEKDNEKLRYDLSYYKSYSKRLKEKNEKYKKVIGNVSEFINEYRKHRNVFKWNEQDYIDVIDKIDELLKEVE
jgi:hypothetical protein